MTTFLGSYERPRREKRSETTRVGRLLELADDTMTGVVDLAGETFELPVAVGKYREGAYVSVLESKGKPRRVLGPASVRPEGLADTAPLPPAVTGQAPNAPRELSQEHEDLIHNSADLIEQVAEDTDAALTNLTNSLSDLDGSTSRTQFKVGPPTSPGRVEGDQWIEIDNDGDGVTGWRWTGNNWVEYQLTDAMFDYIGVNKLRVKNGNFDSAVIERLGVDGMDARIVRTSILQVGSGNLIPNGDGRINYNAGQFTHYPGVAPADSGAVGSWAVNPNSTGTYPFLGDESAPIRVTPGEEYELTYWVRSTSGTGSVRTAFRIRDANYDNISYTNRGPTNPVTTTWQQYRLQIPGQWITGPYLEINLTLEAGVVVYTAGWELRPKVGGRLIVDGAIDGKTIIGATFLTSSDTDNAGVWDQDGLRIYRQGVLQAELSPDNPFGLAVRHPKSGEMLPLSTHVFGNEVWAPVPTFEFPASTNDWTDHFGEVYGTFTAVSDRYMITHSARADSTQLNDGWFFQNYGVQFHRPATGWTSRAPMGSSQGPYGGSLDGTSTIHLAAGATYEVSGLFRARKPGGVGDAKVNQRLIHLQPIH